MLRRHGLTFTAFGLALMFNIGWSYYSDYQKEQAPATDWFYVQSINVADGYAGQDIPIIYDRVIKKPFIGQWFVEIKRAADQVTVCRGDGVARYDPADQLPEGGVTLDWITGKKCPLPPGQFFLEAYYSIKPDNYPDKSYRVASNLFTLK